MEHVELEGIPGTVFAMSPGPEAVTITIHLPVGDFGPLRMTFPKRALREMHELVVTQEALRVIAFQEALAEHPNYIV